MVAHPPILCVLFAWSSRTSVMHSERLAIAYYMHAGSQRNLPTN